MSLCFLCVCLCVCSDCDRLALSAPPCLHICSCSDRNSTRPSLNASPLFRLLCHSRYSLLHEDRDHQRGIVRYFVKLFYQCDCCAVIRVCLHHTRSLHLYRNVKNCEFFCPALFCFSGLVCKHQCSGFKSDFETLLHLFSLFQTCVHCQLSKYDKCFNFFILSDITLPSAGDFRTDRGSERTIKTSFPD